MEISVGAGVERPVEVEVGVEADRPGVAIDEPSIRVRLLGPLTVQRSGVEVPLPASRKARGLFAYLASTSRPVGRSALCALLWEVPNDPRAELRWCLSKIRSVIDEPARRRVYLQGDAVGLELADCFVDAAEVERAKRNGIEELNPERLRTLHRLCGGDFLEGLEIDRSPEFSAWLTAQRRRFRASHVAVLEQLVKSVSDDETFQYLDEWLRLAPFDRRAHETLLGCLVRRGSMREAEEHVAVAVRRFESEGLDSAPVRKAWRDASRGSPIVTTSVREKPEGAVPRRGSIAVMPFGDDGATAVMESGVPGALARDVIARLAKLRSLFVIAPGTVFALSEQGMGPEEAGRILNVDYVVGGSVRTRTTHLEVTVEMVETRSFRIAWTETFKDKIDDAFLVLDEIGNRIVASIAAEIESIERDRAMLRPPSSLNAWEAYHRGLWHMYRYRKKENDQARAFFQRALQLDPTFSRAYAGLSFTHFQDAFQSWAERSPHIDRAYDAAAQGIMADERDPAAHWAMGRALWLRGRSAESVRELERSLDLSPNFALGYYNLAFVHSILGDAHKAIESSDRSRELSPFDPMLFGMLATRAMALARLGRFEEAADWAAKAAARPNAFPHIHAIAALTTALAGASAQARWHAAAITKASPRYSLAEFFRTFPFESEGKQLFRQGAKILGWSDHE